MFLSRVLRPMVTLFKNALIIVIGIRARGTMTLFMTVSPTMRVRNEPYVMTRRVTTLFFNLGRVISMTLRRFSTIVILRVTILIQNLMTTVTILNSMRQSIAMTLPSLRRNIMRTLKMSLTTPRITLNIKNGNNLMPTLSTRALLNLKTYTTIIIRRLNLTLQPINRMRTIMGVRTSMVRLTLNGSRNVIRLSVIILGTILPRRESRLTKRLALSKNIRSRTIVRRITRRTSLFQFFNTQHSLRITTIIRSTSLALRARKIMRNRHLNANRRFMMRLLGMTIGIRLIIQKVITRRVNTMNMMLKLISNTPRLSPITGNLGTSLNVNFGIIRSKTILPTTFFHGSVKRVMIRRNSV